MLTKTIALAVAAAIVPAAASATTITFDNVATGGTQSYSEGGFTFTAANANGTVGNLYGTGGGLSSIGSETRIIVKASDGGLFTLSSIALSIPESFFFETTQDVNLQYVFATGPAQGDYRVINIGPNTPLQTFADFASTPLKELRIWGAGGNEGTGTVKIDNLVVNALVTSAAPEPATWAMMIGGFGVAGASLRRRKTKTTVRFA